MSDITAMIAMKKGMDAKHSPSVKKFDDGIADPEIEKLVKVADDFYEKIYNDHDLDDALMPFTNYAYDHLSSNMKDIIAKMAEYRGDYYSSDREIASALLAMAHENYI